MPIPRCLPQTVVFSVCVKVICISHATHDNWMYCMRMYNIAAYLVSESICDDVYIIDNFVPFCHWQQAYCRRHPCSLYLELLLLQQWASPGPQCRVLQDTMWAIRDRTLELPQWWLHSMKGLWEGPTLVSHWVVWNQEQPTGSECGLQMEHQSVVRQGRWMWQLWKAVSAFYMLQGVTV